MLMLASTDMMLAQLRLAFAKAIDFTQQSNPIYF
jgi:hypothetical protein